LSPDRAAADDLRCPGVRRSGRSDVLRTKLPGPVPARRRLCRQDPARGEAGRDPGGATDQIRSRHQSHHRQGARAHRPRVVPAARRRGDRMTRRLPPPWHADKFSGGYVVRDANGFAVAYVYGRSTEAEALEAKQMTMDEARRVASNIAKLPDMLKRGE